MNTDFYPVELKFERIVQHYLNSKINVGYENLSDLYASAFTTENDDFNRGQVYRFVKIIIDIIISQKSTNEEQVDTINQYYNKLYNSDKRDDYDTAINYIFKISNI